MQYIDHARETIKAYDDKIIGAAETMERLNGIYQQWKRASKK